MNVDHTKLFTRIASLENIARHSDRFSFEVTKEMLDFLDNVYDPIEPDEFKGIMRKVLESS